MSLVEGRATPVVRRPTGVASVLPGLLLGIVAVMMLEQSARWLVTALNHGSFVRDEFQIDHLRDQPGKGGFAYDGVVVSTGEQVHSTQTLIVSVEVLREREAARSIPGARVPIWYLPANSRRTALDTVVPFRIQAPEVFEADASIWTIVNLLAAAGAVWLIRKGVRTAKQSAALGRSPSGK